MSTKTFSTKSKDSSRQRRNPKKSSITIHRRKRFLKRLIVTQSSLLKAGTPTSTSQSSGFSTNQKRRNSTVLTEARDSIIISTLLWLIRRWFHQKWISTTRELHACLAKKEPLGSSSKLTNMVRKLRKSFMSSNFKTTRSRRCTTMSPWHSLEALRPSSSNSISSWKKQRQLGQKWRMKVHLFVRTFKCSKALSRARWPTRY